MFIQTEQTPNPATLKFLPGKTVMDEGVAEFTDPTEAERLSPLASRVFKVDGVTGVYLGGADPGGRPGCHELPRLQRRQPVLQRQG